MAELVDALVLGTSALGRESSSLSPSTRPYLCHMTTKRRRKGEPVAPRVAHVDFYVDKERTFVKYVKYLSSPWHILWRNFLVGSAQGVGFVVGTAILLTLIGFFINSILGHIPFFSDFSAALNLWLERTLEPTQ